MPDHRTGAIPKIPPEIMTLDRLDRWIDREAPMADGLAARLRMHVAVMDRAAEIGRRQREVAAARCGGAA